MKIGDLVKIKDDYNVENDPFKHELEPGVGYAGVVIEAFRTGHPEPPYVAVVFTNGHVVDYFYGNKFVILSSI